MSGPLTPGELAQQVAEWRHVVEGEDATFWADDRLFAEVQHLAQALESAIVGAEVVRGTRRLAT